MATLKSVQHVKPASKPSLRLRIRQQIQRNLSEEEELMIYTERAERFLHFSKSPFIVSQDHGQELLQSERAPTWLDLYQDLALVGALSVFSSSHEVSSGNQFGTYVSFFTLLWYVWTTQTLYDVRYEMSDWVHRFAKLSQFAVFAFLAAFSANFDATTYSAPPNLDSNVNVDWAFASRSFRGVTATLAISRSFLAIQYLVVLYHSAPSHRIHHLLQPLVCAAAGLCFIGAHFVPGSGYGPAAAKICLIYGAMFVECVVTAWTSRRKRGGGKLPRLSMLAERFGLVTLIILGEGALSLFEALAKSVSSLGLGSQGYARAICAILILFALWWIIFDQFDKERPLTSLENQLFIWLHYPFHLFLVLYLQGVKRLVIHQTLFSVLTQTFSDLERVVSNVIQNPGQTFDLSLYPKLQTALELLSISFPDVNNVGEGATQADVFTRFCVGFLGTIFTRYGVEMSRELETEIDQLSKGNTHVDYATVEAVCNQLLYLGTAYVRWICPCLGAVLVLWVIMDLVQRRVRDRLYWYLTACRLLIGFLWCFLGIMSLTYRSPYLLIQNPDLLSISITVVLGGSTLAVWLDSSWILPVMAIAMWFHILAQYAISGLSIPFYKRKRQRQKLLHKNSDFASTVAPPLEMDDKLFPNISDSPQDSVLLTPAEVVNELRIDQNIGIRGNG